MRFSNFIAFSGVLALVGAGACAEAQTGRPAPNDKPISPQAMPGDYFDIPQSAQIKVPLGPPAGSIARPSHDQPPPVPSPGLSLALEAAQAAEKSCSADGYAVTVAVTDSAGNLKAALAPDEARTNGVYMAMHKDVTVVGFKMSTLDLRHRIEQDPPLLAKVKPNMSLLPGGLPIFKGTEFIGAIAASGAEAHEEEKCAADGISQIRSRL